MDRFEEKDINEKLSNLFVSLLGLNEHNRATIKKFEEICYSYYGNTQLRISNQEENLYSNEEKKKMVDGLEKELRNCH